MNIKIKMYNDCNIARLYIKKLEYFLTRNGHYLSDTGDSDNYDDIDLVILCGCVVFDGMIPIYKSMITDLPVTTLVYGCVAKYPGNLFDTSIYYDEANTLDAVFKTTISYTETLKEFSRIEAKEKVIVVWISSGCTNNCSFCNVKIIKPKIESLTPEQIVSEINHNYELGLREIQLLSEDVASYGMDLPGAVNFVALLGILYCNFPDAKLTLYSLNPDGYLRYKTTIDHYVELGFITFIKMCLQSGSDPVLLRMNRRYNTQSFLDSIRPILDKVTVSSMYVVNFPGETLEDFYTTLDFARNFVNAVFMQYSDNKYTAAYKLDKKLTQEDFEKRKEIYNEYIAKYNITNWALVSNSEAIAYLGNK